MIPIAPENEAPPPRGPKILGWTLATMIIAAIAAAIILLAVNRHPMPECRLCERPVHPRTAFSLDVGGRKSMACCPKCGLEMAREAGVKAANLEATDYTTGRPAPASSCLYVEGSRLVPCCSPNAIVVGEKVSCGKCFDRCYPSAIAFLDVKAAARFCKEQGGTILSFDTLRRQMERP